MKRAALLCLALLCLPAAARAYDPAALAADSAAFLDAENHMHRDLSTAAAALRRSQPLLAPVEAPTFSADLSLGQILAPGFSYRNLLQGRGPFESQAGSGAASWALAPSAGGAIAFRGGASFTLNASLLPTLNTGGTERSLFRIGGSGYWRILPERFYSIGLLAGGGATYVHGTEARGIDASFLDGTTPTAFSGRLDSAWDTGILDLELFVHKTFFILNFYSRANLCLVLGSSSSTLSGLRVAGAQVPGAAAEYSSTLSSPALGLVLAGGLELILGELKLAAEGGRDWLSGSLYGSIGLRYGM